MRRLLLYIFCTERGGAASTGEPAGRGGRCAANEEIGEVRERRSRNSTRALFQRVDPALYVRERRDHAVAARGIELHAHPVLDARAIAGVHDVVERLPRPTAVRLEWDDGLARQSYSER